jgi:hypothetical protein
MPRLESKSQALVHKRDLVFQFEIKPLDFPLELEKMKSHPEKIFLKSIPILSHSLIVSYNDKDVRHLGVHTPFKGFLIWGMA